MMSGGPNEDRWRDRSDQAADGFRALGSVLVGGFIIFTDDTKLDSNAIAQAQFAAFVALFLLGLSWVIQKSKSLKNSKKGRRIEFPDYLSNEVYDVTAFALFLFAVGRLVFEGWCPGVALIFAAVGSVSFILLVVLLNSRIEIIANKSDSVADGKKRATAGSAIAR